MRRGRLNAAIRSRQCRSSSIGSGSAPVDGTTNATTSSSPVVVASPDDGHLEHVGVLDQRALDLGRRHPDPACLDHVVVAAEERVGAVGRSCVHVARTDPTVAERGLRRLRPIVVADGRGRPLHVEIARGVGLGHDLIGIGAELGGVAGDRNPARARRLPVERVRDEDVQQLCRTDAVEHRRARQRRESLLHVGRERLAGRDRRPDRRERPGRRVGVEQRGAEAGTGEEQRRALGSDQLDERRRRRRIADGGSRWRRPRTGTSASCRARRRRTAWRPRGSGRPR